MIALQSNLAKPETFSGISMVILTNQNGRFSWVMSLHERWRSYQTMVLNSLYQYDYFI